MNHSDTPIGGSEKEKLNQYQEINIKEVSSESLAQKWADFLQGEAEFEYGEQFCEVITFDMPATNVREKVGGENTGLNSTLQNIESSAIKVVRPEMFVKASKFYAKTKTNAKAYDKERANAKQQSRTRREIANNKIEKEKGSANKEDEVR